MKRFPVFAALSILTAGAVSLAIISRMPAPVPIAITGCYILITAAGVCWQRIGMFISVISKIKTSEKVLYLTFDDGPDPQGTLKVLDLLQKHKAKGTFFTVGKKVRSYPEIIRRIEKEGHALGSHTENHYPWTNILLGKRLRKEINGGAEALKTLTGKEIRLFRFPMGLTNPSIARAVRHSNLKPVGWSIRSFDTIHKNPEKILRRLLRARAGDIILLHDSGKNIFGTLEALGKAIQFWQDQGYRFLSLKNCLDIPLSVSNNNE